MANLSHHGMICSASKSVLWKANVSKASMHNILGRSNNEKDWLGIAEKQGVLPAMPEAT
jgi:hypothetical protein